MKLTTTLYLAIALALSIAVNLWQWRDAAVDKAAARATASGKLDRAQDANAAARATIAELQGALADSFAGRVFDRLAATAALDAHAKARARLQRDHDRALSDLASLLAGRCRDWAAMPACGVVP